MLHRTVTLYVVRCESYCKVLVLPMCCPVGWNGKVAASIYLCSEIKNLNISASKGENIVTT